MRYDFGGLIFGGAYNNSFGRVYNLLTPYNVVTIFGVNITPLLRVEEVELK